MSSGLHVKIMICGDVEGNFRALFGRVEAILKTKGAFEYLLCVGDFFGEENKELEDLRNGTIKVPLDTYVLGPNKKEHVQFYDDRSNGKFLGITFLGKRGQITGSTGLRIAYLSGLESDKSTGYTFSYQDVMDLTNSITDPVDILLTSQWPKGVTKYAKELENSDASERGSSSIAFVAKQLKPRYHFSGKAGIYYERLPYRNHQVLRETSTHSTRFIGLAPVKNDKKLKHLYAFTIVPLSSLTSKQLLNDAGTETECPYEGEDYQNQFFYDTESTGSRKRSGGETAQSAKKKPRNPVSQDKCWFCLENPNFEQHLVLIVGNHIYLTLAKGGLVYEHILIVPINHSPTSIHMSAVEEYEINLFKQAIMNYFHDNHMDVVFFERTAVSPHLQIQVVPIPKTVSPEIKEKIKKFAATNGIELNDLSKYALVSQLVPPRKDFFYVEIWVNKKKEGRLLHIIEGMFPLQFGRMMLASKDILNIPEKVDWKNCRREPHDEHRIVENFKMDFKKYLHHK